jgi:hypothetical protein
MALQFTLSVESHAITAQASLTSTPPFHAILDFAFLVVVVMVEVIL